MQQVAMKGIVPTWWKIKMRFTTSDDNMIGIEYAIDRKKDSEKK